LTEKINYPDKIIIFEYNPQSLAEAIETIEKLKMNYKVGKYEGKEPITIRTKAGEEFIIEHGTWTIVGWKR